MASHSFHWTQFCLIIQRCRLVMFCNRTKTSEHLSAFDFYFIFIFCIEVFVFRFSLAEIPVHPFRVQLFYGCQFSRFFFLLFYLSFAVRTWRCCETKTFHSQHFVCVFIQESNWLSDITRLRNKEPTNWWAKITEAK